MSMNKKAFLQRVPKTINEKEMVFPHCQKSSEQLMKSSKDKTSIKVSFTLFILK